MNWGNYFEESFDMSERKSLWENFEHLKENLRSLSERYFCNSITKLRTVCPKYVAILKYLLVFQNYFIFKEVWISTNTKESHEARGYSVLIRQKLINLFEINVLIFVVNRCSHFYNSIISFFNVII